MDDRWEYLMPACDHTHVVPDADDHTVTLRCDTCGLSRTHRREDIPVEFLQEALREFYKALVSPEAVDPPKHKDPSARPL